MPPALEVAVHGTIIATVGTIVIALYNGTLFAWHPILMSLGFLGIMSEGVLTALKFRRLEGPPRAAAIQRHFWIQLLAVTAVAGGFWAIYQNKVLPDNDAILLSLHGCGTVEGTMFSVSLYHIYPLSTRQALFHNM